MNVDVFYDGLVVQRGSAARDEAGGAFIELELPLPVGTRIAVRGPDGERQARVTRVHEGLGSGVLVQFGDAKPLGDAGSERTASQVPQHSAAPPVPVSDRPTAQVPIAAMIGQPPPAAPPPAAVAPPAPEPEPEPAEAAAEPEEPAAKPDDKPDTPPTGNDRRSSNRERRRGRSKTIIGR
jgi:outer membrane biosynthesis protein TonB